jgi:hypothetical protein
MLVLAGFALIGAGDDAQITRLSNTYFACVHRKAAKVGARETISADLASKIVRRCDADLRPFVDAVVASKQRLTNLPEGRETTEVRRAVATSNIQTAAAMQISANVLPVAVP